MTISSWLVLAVAAKEGGFRKSHYSQLVGVWVGFFNSPLQSHLQDTVTAETGLLQRHTGGTRHPWRCAWHQLGMSSTCISYRQPRKSLWHDGTMAKFPWAAQSVMELRRRLSGQKEGGWAHFVARPMGIALGSCLLPPPPPSWQPPLCCQAQVKFPLVRGKASRSTCYVFIQHSFNHILKCEINGTVYIPLFFIRNKLIFTLGMQLNTRVMKKHSF